MTKSISEAFRDWLIEPVIQKLHEQETKTMSQIDDLIAQVAALKDAASKAAVDVAAAFARLEAKIAALPGAPDLTAEIADLKTATDALSALDTSAQAEGN